jgi:hypothetical protein
MMTKIAVDSALGARLTGPLEITDKDGRTLGCFLTADELVRLRRAAEAHRRQAYERGREILPDTELLADAASADDLCPPEEMERYRLAALDVATVTAKSIEKGFASYRGRV